MGILPMGTTGVSPVERTVRDRAKMALRLMGKACPERSRRDAHATGVIVALTKIAETLITFARN
jgi:hypothetical protein